MEIKKGLSFDDVINNLKEKAKTVIAIIAIGIVGFLLLVYMEENHIIISEKGAVVMGQGLFLGVIFGLWGIISRGKK